MAKKIYFGSDVQKRLGEGIDSIANAVRVTLGPKGRNVAMEQSFGPPTITKDGVSVARQVEFDDVRKLGADIAKEASIRTAEQAGDGTTSSMVLVQAIYSLARKADAAGMHPIFMQRGMTKGLHDALEFLYELAMPVENAEEIASVATLASNGDRALGELIAEAMEKVGKDGVISVEEGTAMETTLEEVLGLQLDNGYESPHYLVEPEAVSIEFSQPLILLADKKIGNPMEIAPALELSVQTNRPIVIISHGLEGVAQQTVIMNTRAGRIKAVSVRAPRINEKRSEILKNLAVLTGGMVISDVTGVNLESYEAQDVVGGADNVTVGKDTSTVLDGHGDDESIKTRIKELRARKEMSGSEHDREFYQQQASQLGGGIAVIRVGAPSELALKEYKARVEDALSATESAVEQGIVPGGATTYLEVSDYLQSLLDDGETGITDESELQGYKILIQALREPFCRIMVNAGLEPYEQLFKLRAALAEGPGKVMDIRSGEIMNAMDAGVIDPAKVVAQVMTNAVSTAGIAMTSACMITSSDTEDCFSEDDED